MSEDSPGGLRRLRDWLEIMSFVAVILGIVVGFAEHFANKAKEREAAREALYDSLDAEYRDHLLFCAEHPRVNPRLRALDAAPHDLTREEQLQQRVMFTLLIDLFERVYLEFHDPDTLELIADEIADDWPGWEKYIDEYAKTPEFRAEWERVGGESDANYQAWMKSRIEAAKTN